MGGPLGQLGNLGFLPIWTEQAGASMVRLFLQLEVVYYLQVDNWPLHAFSEKNHQVLDPYFLWTAVLNFQDAHT